MAELADVGVDVAEPADVGLVELADVDMEVVDSEDVGVSIDVTDPENKEVDMVELAEVVELANVGKQHKQLMHLL